MNTAISIGRHIGNDRFDLLHQTPISKWRSSTGFGRRLLLGDFNGFLANLAFHRLLAEQALQFLDLVLKGAILGSRNDFFLRRGGG